MYLKEDFSENIPECLLMAWFMASRIRYPDLLDVIGRNSSVGPIINTLLAPDVWLCNSCLAFAWYVHSITISRSVCGSLARVSQQVTDDNWSFWCFVLQQSLKLEKPAALSLGLGCGCSSGGKTGCPRIRRVVVVQYPAQTACQSVLGKNTEPWLVNVSE